MQLEGDERELFYFALYFHFLCHSCVFIVGVSVNFKFFLILYHENDEYCEGEMSWLLIN